MGTYTTVQKFYRPDETDLVNVDTDIKYNWERLDDRVKKILEWAPTDQPTLPGNVPQENNFKYYKTETGSKWASWDNGSGTQVLEQDDQAFTPNWTLITLGAAWINAPAARLMASIVAGAPGSENIVSWRGLVRLASGAELPIKTDTIIATGISGLYRPATTDREVQVYGGDAAVGTPSTMMLRFTTTGEIHMFKYGLAQGLTSLDRFVPFSSVQYTRD